MAHHPLPVDDPKCRRPDISRARGLLNWEPRVSLEEGLDRTIDYFRDLSLGMANGEVAKSAPRVTGQIALSPGPRERATRPVLPGQIPVPLVFAQKVLPIPKPP